MKHYEQESIYSEPDSARGLPTLSTTEALQRIHEFETLVRQLHREDPTKTPTQIAAELTERLGRRIYTGGVRHVLTPGDIPPPQRLGIVKRQERLLELKTKNPNWTQEQLAEQLGCSTNTVNRYISHLTIEGRWPPPSPQKEHTDDSLKITAPMSRPHIIPDDAPYRRNVGGQTLVDIAPQEEETREQYILRLAQITNLSSDQLLTLVNKHFSHSAPVHEIYQRSSERQATLQAEAQAIEEAQIIYSIVSPDGHEEDLNVLQSKLLELLENISENTRIKGRHLAEALEIGVSDISKLIKTTRNLLEGTDRIIIGISNSGGYYCKNIPDATKKLRSRLTEISKNKTDNSEEEIEIEQKIMQFYDTDYPPVLTVIAKEVGLSKQEVSDYIKKLRREGKLPRQDEVQKRRLKVRLKNKQK